MYYVIIEREEFFRQVGYVFNLFSEIYGIQLTLLNYHYAVDFSFASEDAVIFYGAKKVVPESLSSIHIYPGELFDENYLKKSSLPPTPLKRFNGLPLIYEGEGPLPSPVVIRKNAPGGKKIETNIDIIASSFFLLSRYEEILNEARDDYGRFSAFSSLAHRERFLNRPLVNEYFELLWGWLSELDSCLTKRRPWGDHNYAACLTHDIDTVEKFRRGNSWRDIFKVAFADRDPYEAWERLLARGGKEPYDTFNYILRLNRRYGFKSSFYFACGGNSKYDPVYRVESPQIIRVINKLKNRSEIGLHGSFKSTNNYDVLLRDKSRLEKVLKKTIGGIRQHYLRFNAPLTWRLQEQAGFYYDTTLCFAEEPGFRCGICTPFRPFDVIKNTVIDIYELPLTVMDGSLFDYQKLSIEEAFIRIQELINTVSRYTGVFVLLWHNTTLDKNTIPNGRRLYRSILEYIRGSNAFTGTAIEVIREWEKA